MRLATIRTGSGTRAVRVEPDRYVDVDGVDVGAVLGRPDWRRAAAEVAGPSYSLDHELAPVVPRPGKIVCVGLNYRSHILEMGRDLPEFPTLFAKFSESLIGPADPISVPPESESVDWEAELAVVIGESVRRANDRAASAAIAGFTVMNDVTMRDWQYRTPEWLQGKTFEATTPLGPQLVTCDELTDGAAPALSITTAVNGEVMQKANTSDLVFTPVDLVKYVSTITTLRPGDVIATGTPGGVGHARTPPRFLRDGDVLVTEIDGLGRLHNTARAS